MEKGKLIYKLREFHILEVYQVDFYNSQIKSLEEPHIRKAFERFVIREKEHVNYFSQKLKELGSSPLKVFPPAFAAAGFVTGKALDLLSLKERYKLGISFENKAAEMYLSFIEMSAMNPELAELNDRLWYFLIDEEEHQFWFKEQLSKIETSKV